MFPGSVGVVQAPSVVVPVGHQLIGQVDDSASTASNLANFQDDQDDGPEIDPEIDRHAAWTILNFPSFYFLALLTLRFQIQD